MDNNILIGIIIILGVCILFLGIYIIRILNLLPPKETSSLFQQQILEISRQINELQKQQTEVPKVLSEGQVKNLETMQNQINQMVGTFNQHITALTQTLNEQLSKTQGNIGQQLEGTVKVVSDVRMKLGELSETAKNMQEIGKDISKLQDILQVPKLRGNIGELFLEDLLKQILPTRNYEIQYKFKSGQMVDAIIRLGEHIVPVDSKFPLDSFNRIREAKTEEEKKASRKEFIRSVRERIDEIADKYIRPEEGTYDFALMYIPAENVFYEVIIKDDNFDKDKSLSTYAVGKRVIPVSPNSFYAYLVVIVFGLKGMHIEKQAKEIRGKLIELQQSFGKFYEVFNKLGKNILWITKNFEEARRIAERFNDKISLVTGKSLELEEDEKIPLSLKDEEK